MRTHILPLILPLLLWSAILPAQELRCNVTVSSQKIQGTNRELFSNMQRDIHEFINNKRWSGYVFSYDERIDCTLQFTLNEQIGSDQFKGTLQIRVSRPVYNASYATPILNYKDNDIEFTYHEFETLDYNEVGENSNLVNLLAFYANIILGIDSDSFSLMGGNEFFSRAEHIVARCQNVRESGWKSFESRRNRYWFINNLQDRSYSSVRECFYRYHRHGLDLLADNLTDGRLAIVEALELLQKANRTKPNAYVMQVFFDAKADEIVNIFKSAFPDERKRVYNIVTDVNPANTSKYNVLSQERPN